MPSYKNAFPSKYMRASDLGTSRPILTIQHVGFEDVGSGKNQERRLVVQWDDRHWKDLVLNQTNAKSIEKIAGTDDYEQWPGVQVQLYATETDFQGERVACIRILAPKAKATKSRSKPAGSVADAETLTDASAAPPDDIPF